MIRLGSLAGYPFEGPRILGGWTPPAQPAVFAVLCQDGDNPGERFAVIYVGHSDDLATEGFPFSHPHSGRWVRRAGSQWKLRIATYVVPGGSRAHREQIAQELCAIYRPSCNDQQFDRSWKDEWIGEYTAPITGPPTTAREVDPRVE